MDGATIQAKIYAGRAKAALRLGLDCGVFRPLVAGAALANQIATTKAAFNAGDNSYKTPNLPGDAIWYGDFDGRLTRPGDYLVRVADGQTYYIAGQQQLLPIVCIDCNRSIKITRENAAAAVGAIGYSGNQQANETDVLGATGNFWPCSILIGGKSNAGVGLPAGVKNVGWQILLPPSVPITIMAGDIATDDLGRRYAIEGAENTDLGWRINASEVHS